MTAPRRRYNLLIYKKSPLSKNPLSQLLQNVIRLLQNAIHLFQNVIGQLFRRRRDFPRCPFSSSFLEPETPSDTHSTHGRIGPGLHIHIRITDIYHMVEPDAGNLRHYLMHDCRVRFYRLSLSLAQHLDEPELAEKVTYKLLCALLIFVRGQCGMTPASVIFFSIPTMPG